jgi:hypothetical protein
MDTRAILERRVPGVPSDRAGVGSRRTAVNAEALRTELCRAFCSDLSVAHVPSGLAVSGALEDRSGDRIIAFVERLGDGWRLADDGQFLAELSGRGVDWKRGSRADFIRQVLASATASVVPNDTQIATATEVEPPKPRAVIQFLAALVRVRDVAFWTQERVRSTFKDDAIAALEAKFGTMATLARSVPVTPDLGDFPADVLIAPNDARLPRTAVFLVQTVDALNEALMLWQEARLRGTRDVRVAALIEDGAVTMGSPKVQRTVNRIDAVAFFRGDEQAAMDRIERTAIGS